MLSSLLLKNLPYKYRKRATNGETLTSTSSSHHSSLRPEVARATSEKHLLGQTSTPHYQVNSPSVGIVRGTAPSNKSYKAFLFFLIGGPSEEFLGPSSPKAFVRTARCEIPSHSPGVCPLKVDCCGRHPGWWGLSQVPARGSARGHAGSSAGRRGLGRSATGRSVL